MIMPGEEYIRLEGDLFRIDHAHELVRALDAMRDRNIPAAGIMTRDSTGREHNNGVLIFSKEAWESAVKQTRELEGLPYRRAADGSIYVTEGPEDEFAYAAHEIRTQITRVACALQDDAVSGERACEVLTQIVSAFDEFVRAVAEGRDRRGRHG